MTERRKVDIGRKRRLVLSVCAGLAALAIGGWRLSPIVREFRLRRMDTASLIRLTASSPEETDALIELARRAESQGFMDEAARNYLAAAKADRGKARYWNRATEISIERGDRDGAVQSATSGVLAEPSSSKAHQLYGEILGKDNAWGKAYEEYQKSVGLDKNNSISWEGVAKSAFETHRWSEAANAAAKAESLKPENFSPALIRGKAEMALGDLVHAEGALRKANRLAPANADALTALGELYASLPDTESNRAEAERSFSKASQILANLPESHAPLYEWGQWLLAKNRYADAANKFKLALKAKPEDSRTMYALSRALQLSGKSNEALELLKKFERDHAISLLISQLQNRIGREPENAALFARLGDAYREKDQFELSLKAWDRSLLLSPNQPALRKKRDSAQASPSKR